MIKGLTITLIYSYETTSQLKRSVDSILSELPEIKPLVGTVEWLLVRTPKAIGKDISFFPGKVIFSETENLAINRNLALEKSRTQAFYFIDPDCWLSRGSLKNLCQAFIQMKDDSSICAFAGPNILYSENQNLESQFRWLGKLRYLNGGLSQVAIPNKDRFDWHSPTCHILYNRDHLGDQVFSSKFESVGEDLEFHFRLKQLKKKIYICSQATVRHEQPGQSFDYFKKIFRYGTAQTRLLRHDPLSFTNKRLTVLFGFLTWLTVLLVSSGNFQNLFLIVSGAVAALFLFWENFSYEGEKRFFSHTVFYLMIAVSYLLGQFSGLMIPLQQKKSVKAKMANRKNF